MTIHRSTTPGYSLSPSGLWRLLPFLRSLPPFLFCSCSGGSVCFCPCGCACLCARLFYYVGCSCVCSDVLVSNIYFRAPDVSPLEPGVSILCSLRVSFVPLFGRLIIVNGWYLGSVLSPVVSCALVCVCVFWLSLFVINVSLVFSPLAMGGCVIKQVYLSLYLIIMLVVVTSSCVYT